MTLNLNTGHYLSDLYSRRYTKNEDLCTIIFTTEVWNMNIRNALMLMAATSLLCGCSEKTEKGNSVNVVKVKTMTMVPVHGAGSQGYSGTIEEQSGSALSFASIGMLKSVGVSEGQMVKAGQLIATIDETSVRSAYDAALAAKEQALDAQQRMKMLHDAGSLPEIKWIEVETQVRQALSAEKMAKKALTDTRLYAPFSGYVARKQAEAGQSVAPGVPIVQLVRIDQVKVKISVPEDEIAQISKGQTLWVRVAALGNRQYEARVTEKGVTADALSRSYEVKAVIANPRHELLPGMIAEVETSTSPSQRGSGGYTLPAEIVQIDADNRPFVWRTIGGKAEKAYITIGENVGDQITITGGLEPGDKVICEGQQKVSNGMEVNDN